MNLYLQITTPKVRDITRRL